MKIYPMGSEWTKWDLHVHAPFGKLYAGYTAEEGEDVLEKFCEALEASDVMVFGITDYFSFESFSTFREKFDTKYPKSEKRFFFNLELRLNEAVNQAVEEVNVHLIFSPGSLDQVEKFLSRLEVVKTGKDETPIMCSELNSDADFQAATVKRDSITNAFKQTFGKKAVRSDYFLVFTAANNDGIRPERGKRRKEGICDEIDKFSDGFFGGIQNSEYYLNINRLEDEQVIAKKPTVAGSDSHSFVDLSNFLGNRVTEEIEDNGETTEKILKDVTWVKADPTFEGLRQILYEPIPGERVAIGPVKPDQKDEYKVIRKISFNDPETFPSEIVFNGNLTSIIGSRSSGKSALLAYVAHSIDPTFVENVIPGPGEGEEYHWHNLDIEYAIEWENGESNENSPGKVVYIRQNYLFEESKNPDEIKSKIQPVLFRAFPDFRESYERNTTDIDSANREIRTQTENWFTARNTIDALTKSLRDLGDKKAIEKEKAEVESSIQKLKEKNCLSDEDVEEYQRITGEISGHETRIKEIDTETAKFSGISEKSGFFKKLIISLTPSLEGLPSNLKKSITKTLKGNEEQVLAAVNMLVREYASSISKEKSDSVMKIGQIKGDKKKLLDKYKKNLELEGLVQKVNALEKSIKAIDEKQGQKKDLQSELETGITIISTKLSERSGFLRILETAMDETEQAALQGIKFGVECEIHDSVQDVMRGINLKGRTEFVERGELKIYEIRKKAGTFLEELHTGRQKVIARYNPETVAKDALTLTEKVLFTAHMEGDKIGGFSEPTMTPGKRALFALRLILIESEDTWPLLIDQPEDDLDSRSIYDDVVPFLKEKKKERQIIMVTHNANLVVGSDSEQVIVANRNGDDRKNEDKKEFNYLSGSLEHTQEKDEACEDTLKAQGICEHSCEILDGGKTAFENRKNKYNIR